LVNCAPGFTSRKGRFMRVLAKDRICLSKLLKKGDDKDEEEKKMMVDKSMEEVKMASVCLKYSAK
jgi:hypothetical protein